MKRLQSGRGVIALALGLALIAPVAARADGVAPSGTRLDLVATGEVTRMPDIVTLSAGVITQALSAAAAMAQNADRMAAATAALRRAGVADKDIRTAALSLQPQYRYGDNQPPVVTGYQASTTLTVVFRDVKRAGTILDALVGQGVNQISGPDFAVEHPDAALDEARAQAVTSARARAMLYAKAAGLTVRRIVSISEEGTDAPPPPRPMVMMAMARAKSADTELAPGDSRLAVTVRVSFELQ